MLKLKQGTYIVVDPEPTFGELEFLGYGREDRGENKETGEVDAFKRHIYDVLCEKVGSIIEISIYDEDYTVSIPEGTIVTLVNPRVQPFSASGNARTIVVAEGIIPVGKQNNQNAETTQGTVTDSVAGKQDKGKNKGQQS